MASVYLRNGLRERGLSLKKIDEGVEHLRNSEESFLLGGPITDETLDLIAAIINSLDESQMSPMEKIISTSGKREFSIDSVPIPSTDYEQEILVVSFHRNAMKKTTILQNMSVETIIEIIFNAFFDNDSFLRDLDTHNRFVLSEMTLFGVDQNGWEIEFSHRDLMLYLNSSIEKTKIIIIRFFKDSIRGRLKVGQLFSTYSRVFSEQSQNDPDIPDPSSTLDNTVCSETNPSSKSGFTLASENSRNYFGLESKFSRISDSYSGWRSILGDGNCYYRSIIYGYLENAVINDNRDSLFYLYHLLLPLCHYFDEAEEQRDHEYVLDTLRDAFNSNRWHCLADLEHDMLNEQFDLSMIKAVRILLSLVVYLFKDRDFNGITLQHLILASFDDICNIHEYCERYIEVMGVDAEGPFVDCSILTAILQCNSRIVFLDSNYQVDLVYRDANFDLLHPIPPTRVYKGFCSTIVGRCQNDNPVCNCAECVRNNRRLKKYLALKQLYHALYPKKSLLASIKDYFRGICRPLPDNVISLKYTSLHLLLRPGHYDLIYSHVYSSNNTEFQSENGMMTKSLFSLDMKRKGKKKDSSETASSSSQFTSRSSSSSLSPGAGHSAISSSFSIRLTNSDASEESSRNMSSIRSSTRSYQSEPNLGDKNDDKNHVAVKANPNVSSLSNSPELKCHSHDDSFVSNPTQNLKLSLDRSSTAGDHADTGFTVDSRESPKGGSKMSIFSDISHFSLKTPPVLPSSDDPKDSMSSILDEEQESQCVQKGFRFGIRSNSYNNMTAISSNITAKNARVSAYVCPNSPSEGGDGQES